MTEKNKIRFKMAPKEDWKDKYLRSVAELDNFRRRTLQDKVQIATNAKSEIIEQLLPIVDSINSAVKMEASGIEPIAQQMKDTFQKLGVDEIESVGKEFDPNLHNAVMHEEQEGEPANTIVEEFAKGYTYDGKVIRHSMVKVVN